jgi:hypothetical protein
MHEQGLENTRIAVFKDAGSSPGRRLLRPAYLEPDTEHPLRRRVYTSDPRP